MKLVGVLGGMGPEATVVFQNRLIHAVTARDDSDHVPLIVDMNPQVPSRIAHLIEGTGPDPAPTLAAMAQRLANAGAKALVMPCNTAHHYAPAIEAATDVPFLDMVSLSSSRADAVAEPGASIGVLGSPALRRTGVFDPPLTKLGRTALYATDETATLSALRDIKAGRNLAGARASIKREVDILKERGAGAVLIACTEFSIHADAFGSSPNIIDTLDVLVAVVVRFASGETMVSDQPFPERQQANQ